MFFCLFLLTPSGWQQNTSLLSASVSEPTALELTALHYEPSLHPSIAEDFFLASVLSMNHETFQKCSTPVPFLGFLPLFTLSPPSWCCCFRPWPDAETSLAEGTHSLLHS